MLNDRRIRPAERCFNLVPLCGTLVRVVAEKQQTMVAIERATDVLTMFAESEEPTLGVTEIAQALRLSKAVVYRILASFKAKGFVELDESAVSAAPAWLDKGAVRFDDVSLIPFLVGS